MRWIFRLLLVGVLLIVAAFGTLAVNQQKVSLQFLSYQTPELDLFWYLLGTLVLGMLLGWVLSGYAMFNLKMAERRERKLKLQAQTELDSVKAAAAQTESAA